MNLIPQHPPASRGAHRPLARLAQVAALAGLGLLAACGGGGGQTTAPPVADPNAPLALARPGELVTLARQRLDPNASTVAFNIGTPLASVPTLSAATDAASGTTALRSTTLVQEAGVDEPDLLASQGPWVYALDAPSGSGSPRLRVRAHQVQADGSSRPGTAVELPPGDGTGTHALHGLLVAPASQRLAALSQWVSHEPFAFDCIQLANCFGPAVLPAVMITRREVHLNLLRSPGDGSLARESSLAIGGQFVGSRLIGQRLVLVTLHQASLPVAPGAGLPERQAALAALRAADLLPTVRVNGGTAQPLLTETDCYLPAATDVPGSGLAITTITVVDLADPSLARTSRCYAGNADTLYLAPDNLYLAASRSQVVLDNGVARFNGSLITDIHKFTLATLQWRGSGQVDGHLGWDDARRPYRLSEHQGVLRVLSFTGSTGWVSLQDSALRPASPATLTLLREAADGRSLQRVATLPNERRPQALGKPGEQVHGVRFVGERGYLVTFRRTDPLYVLDLSDPTDPRGVGELETPGFADHLFPLPGGLLLGAGRDADSNGQLGGLRFALLDVNNPAAPRERGVVLLGERGSASTLDHTPHGLALRVDGNQVRLAVPVVRASGNGLNYDAGLLPMTVDSSARTLSAKPMLPTGDVPGALALWDQRVMLSGDKMLHLVGGELLTRDW